MPALRKGKEIEELIAQRYPIVMVDVLYSFTNAGVCTGLTVTEDNLFCEHHFLLETGVLEHIAQSASVFVGYRAWLAHEPITMGYIGEIKKCQILDLPKVGEEICTHVRLLHDVMGLLLMEAKSFINSRQIVDCQMKLALEQMQ